MNFSVWEKRKKIVNSLRVEIEVWRWKRSQVESQKQETNYEQRGHKHKEKKKWHLTELWMRRDLVKLKEMFSTFKTPRWQRLRKQQVNKMELEQFLFIFVRVCIFVWSEQHVLYVTCVPCSCCSVWNLVLCPGPRPAPRWMLKAPARTPSSPSTSVRWECASNSKWWDWRLELKGVKEKWGKKETADRSRAGRQAGQYRQAGSYNHHPLLGEKLQSRKEGLKGGG